MRDRATYLDPHQPAAGVTAVLVNGVLALEDGIATSVRAGQLTAGALSRDGG